MSHQYHESSRVFGSLDSPDLLIHCSTCFIGDARSSALFKEYMSGDFGKHLVKQYVDKLEELPILQLDSDELARDYFVLGIIQIGEYWRRFCHKHGSFPHAQWGLCGLEDEELCQELGKFQTQASRCPTCVDAEFTAVLLGQLPCPIDRANPLHLQKARQLQRLLEDLSRFTPISTDAVEALHGFCQSKLHRFRGCKPTDHVGAEICLWAKICSAWKVVNSWIWDRKGDAHSKQRLCKFHNQYACAGGPKPFLRPKLGMSKLRALAKDTKNDKTRFKMKKLCGHLAEGTGAVT